MVSCEEMCSPLILDELIRQITIECAERGLLLLRYGPTFSHIYVHNSFCYVLHIEITMACETLHLVSSQIPARFSVCL